MQLKITGEQVSKMPTIRQEVLDAVRGRYSEGETFKIRHERRLDGSECTPPSKKPAMSVTRTKTGWLFYCHRCGMSGSINDKNNSPSETATRFSQKKRIASKTVEKIELPDDYMSLKEIYDKNPAALPRATKWLWGCGLDSSIWNKYEIGWSFKYQRVIIPIWEYAKFGEKPVRTLVGWVGRDLTYDTKEERVANKLSKYITRTQKDKRRYFIIKGKKADKWVICEDCLSAIKVNEATGYSTIALLNNAIGEDLIPFLKDKTVYMWLDPDMKTKSIGSVARLVQLGTKASHVTSDLDPKNHSYDEIKEKLEW
jgi:hypothetical protein